MTRLVALLMATILAGACTAAPTTDVAPPAGDASPSGPDSPLAIELAAVDLPRLAGSAEDARSAANALNALGFDAYRALVAGGSDGDLVMSPASIALALSMARAGARGTTADEMDAVLHELGRDDHAAWLAALHESLAARTGEFDDATGASHDVTLTIANALFGQRGFRLEPPFLEALAERFDAGLRLVDFVNAREDARRLVNGWVADATEDRIEELLTDDDLDAATALVLVNAIYLKAAWQAPFIAGTSREAFTRFDGTTMDVDMMHANWMLPYATGDGWRAVELPYVGEQLSMLVIAPDDLATFQASLDAASFDQLIAQLRPTQVNVGLPRFGIETRTDLADLLAELGMPTAFSGGADFSGVSRDGGLRISAVIHQANIDVDEKGTEAAAATAVTMTVSSGGPEATAFTVDRPFLYAVRDRETGAILFLGRVTEPRERER
jgi:serpin B